MNNTPVRGKILSGGILSDKLLIGRAKEHIISKQITPWLFINDPDVNTISFGGTRVAITDPQILQLIQVIQHFFTNDVEVVRFNSNIKFVPIDCFFRDVVSNNELVLR